MSRRTNVLRALIVVATALLSSTLTLQAGGRRDSVKGIAKPQLRNVILFVTDGLRHDAVTLEDSPTIYGLRREGVDFVNSHSLFPTVTTANASALATGRGLGDTGSFANTLYDPTKDAEHCPKLPPTFHLEDDLVLAKLNCLHGGSYLGVEDTLINLAHKNNYSTAVVGKLGPAAIQAISQVELAGDNPPMLKEPTTVIIDDKTGTPDGFPIPVKIRERMVKAALAMSSPDRSKGQAANVTQQDYFTNVVVKAILPQFIQNKKPFLLIFWSADPDITQHNQGDSLGALEPGINGATSKEAIHNADHNLREILDSLRELDPKEKGLLQNTDVIVVADHGFSTISKGALDAGNVSKVKSYAADAISDAGVAKGLLPPGFLALDLAHVLQRDSQLYDLDSDPAAPVSQAFASYKQVDPKGNLKFSVRYPGGSALIGGTGDIRQSGEIITVPSGNSELIYLPQKEPDNDNEKKALTAQICEFLTRQNYIDGVFVNNDLGDPPPGTLPLSSIGLHDGSAKLPAPAILVNFKGFPLDPKKPWYTWVEISDTTLQQGQGNHGGLNRADTFNNIVAFGPDFKKQFRDTAPVSNADIARTIAHILSLPLPSSPRENWPGRILSESLDGQPDNVDYSLEVEASKPSANGVRTVLHFQKVNEWRGSRKDTKPKSYLYYDQACFVPPGASGDTKCNFSDPTGLGNGTAAEISRNSQVVQSAYEYLTKQAESIQDYRLKEATQYALTEMEGNKERPGCIEHRAGLTEDKKAAIIRRLIAEGLVKPENGDAFPGGLQAGIFPPVRDDGSDCPQLPQTFRSAPGGAFGKHHSYPGGLTIHEANNEVSALHLVNQYCNVYAREVFTLETCPPLTMDSIRRDILIAAPIWHDWAKTMVFQWNADGTEFKELKFGGNGETDNYGAKGDSSTGAHHIISLAETMKRALPPEFVITQAFAHAHRDQYDEFQIVNWIRAAAILAQIPDPVVAGYLRRDNDGKLRLPVTPGSPDRNLRAEPIPRLEYFLHNLSDTDYLYSDQAVAFAEETLRVIAPEFGCDPKATDYNNKFRNPALSNLTAEGILIAYSVGEKNRENRLGAIRAKLKDLDQNGAFKCEQSRSFQETPSGMAKSPTIISGGQTGVDQAALRAAKQSGRETGGWCPPNCISENGRVPSEFGLKPTPEEKSPKAPDIRRSQRTEWNVRDSDATLILDPKISGCTDAPEPTLFNDDPGTRFTIECAQRYTPRPFLVCSSDDQQTPSRIIQWIRSHHIETLNVAGPAESTSAGIGKQAEKVLLQVFDSLHER
jgi:hypothetical protein